MTRVSVVCCVIWIGALAGCAVTGCDAPPAERERGAPTAGAQQQATSRMLAWQLASRMVEAAISNAGATTGADALAARQAAMQAPATALGVTLPPLPERTASPGAADAARALAWLLEEAGPAVGRQLADKHGPDHEALFKIELLGTVNALLYEPGSPRAVAFADTLEKDAALAGVPHEGPLETLAGKLRSGAPPAEIEAALDALEAAVATQLLTEPR